MSRAKTFKVLADRMFRPASEEADEADKPPEQRRSFLDHKWD